MLYAVAAWRRSGLPGPAGPAADSGPSYRIGGGAAEHCKDELGFRTGQSSKKGNFSPTVPEARTFNST